MTRAPRRLLLALLALLLALGGSARAEPPEYVLEILREAKARAKEVPDQALALIHLAWPHEKNPDPQVQAAARHSLVRFGHRALPMLRRNIPDLDPLYQADAIAAFIEARYRKMSGLPSDYLPGLEETIWFGSPEAQRIALREIARYDFPAAVLSSIDAAYNHPLLTRYIVRSLGEMGDSRARLFLSDLLIEGSDLYKGAAAQALERFGERTVDSLRAGVRSEDAATRQAALRVLLPLAETSDLTLLQDYLEQWPDDDPELRDAAQRRLEVLQRRAAP